jgi:uncharacterized protein
MEIYVIYIIVGIIGGLLVGLVGGGIGPIVVPTLISLLIAKGIDYDIAVHLAVGTSLCIVLTTTSISIAGYHVGKLIYWPILKNLLPGTVVGAVIGSSTAALLSGKMLQIIFGIFLIMTALFILRIKHYDTVVSSNIKLPNPRKLTIMSALLAACSTILGVSDGLLLVPFLRNYKMPMRDTIAIATVCAFSASLTGAIPFLLIGYFDKNLPINTFSYIYLPAFIIIALVCCLSTPIGVILNKVLPEKKLKSVFAIFLFIIGIKMLII